MPRAVNPIDVDAFIRQWSWESGVGPTLWHGQHHEQRAALKRFATDLLEAALAASPSSGAAVIEAPWRAIDTAPLTTWVLVYVPANGRAGAGYYTGQNWWTEIDREPCFPTRWMPLPAPPRDTLRSGEQKEQGVGTRVDGEC